MVGQGGNKARKILKTVKSYKHGKEIGHKKSSAYTKLAFRGVNGLKHIVVHTLNLTIRCTMYDVPCKMYDVRCKMWDVRCTAYTVQCKVYTAHCTLFTVHNSLFTIHCSQFIVHNSLFLNSLFLNSLFTIHCTDGAH